MTDRIAVTFPVWHKYPDEKPVDKSFGIDNRLRISSARYLCMNNNRLEILAHVEGNGFASIVYKKRTTNFVFEGVNVSFWTEAGPLLESIRKDFQL